MLPAIVAKLRSARGMSPRVFDSISGRRHDNFTALTLGAEAAGVEHGAQDVASTAAFVRSSAGEERIPYQERSEKCLRKLGKRYVHVGKWGGVRIVCVGAGRD